MQHHVSLSTHDAFALTNFSKNNLLEDAIKSNIETAYNETGNSSQESLIIFLEDFNDYFFNYNDSQISADSTLEANGDVFEYHFLNCTGDAFSLYPDQGINECYRNSSYIEGPDVVYNYWALILMVFPFLTLFGNVLVIMAVVREKTLQTVTNYFIVSLALADLLVAVVVMPFAVYVLFNGTWGLPPFVCDFYIAMDVICSTSSIFNLVAISIDRYIAVTQPIKYAKHKNNRRVWLTILLVWAISSAIGSPIVLGLNNTPDRLPDLCLFYNSDFIIYSSLSSFYIPCIIMVFLYYNIFKALRMRALKHRATRRPHYSDLTTATVIENVSQTRKLAETVLGPLRTAEEERPTNTASGSNEEDDDQPDRSSEVDDCQTIANDKAADFILATVVEEAGSVVTKLATPSIADANGNNDSGYAPSNVEFVMNKVPTPPVSPARHVKLPASTGSTTSQAHPIRSVKKNGVKQEANKHLAAAAPSIVVPPAAGVERKSSAKSVAGSKKERKSSAASKFTIYKVNKASRKKREKNSAKKERKATKTLAIVLGVFLVCWVPFFTCNIMDATCTKLNMECQPGVTAFILTTWLGYMNSFVNPVIYTIFNPEFRKAFKKLMNIGT